jgi:hypothetical protein
MNRWDFMRWFSIGWWSYLLKDCNSFRNFICRAKGHAGPVWFNASGLEPDMHCKDCGEDLG